MRKATKIWLIIAASLVVVGLGVIATAILEYNGNSIMLSTGQYVSNNHEIGDKFSSVSVNTDTADIVFAVSNDDKCRVECFEEVKAKHSVAIKDDTLDIKIVNEKAWYDYIGINFGSPKVTVYLPMGEYDTISVKGSTGHISVENTFAKEIDISVSTGKVYVSNVICNGDLNINVSTGKTSLSNVRCKELISTGSTGDITLKNVMADELFNIKRSTGNIEFDSSDAAEIFIETDTGDVEGSLLTNKVFITQTDTGDIDVPQTINGGRCEIRTDTGDIKININ